MTCAPQVVLSVKRIDTAGTTGALNQIAAARGELPYRPPPPSTEVPRSWREQLEQESASNMSTELPTCRICHSGHLCARRHNTSAYTTRPHTRKAYTYTHILSDHNGTGDDRLFSPCLCRGSMRYSHFETQRALTTRIAHAAGAHRPVSASISCCCALAHGARVHPHAGRCGLFKKKN